MWWGSEFFGFWVKGVDWDKSSALFWMIVESICIGLSISVVVFRGIFIKMLFSIIFENWSQLVCPDVREWMFLLIIAASIRVKIMGVWSEERSRELVMLWLTWFGSVVTKKVKNFGVYVFMRWTVCWIRRIEYL